MTQEEKRRLRYPDTETFHYHNQNPKNRITGDCVYRAISLATGMSYSDTVRSMAEFQATTYYDVICSTGINKYLKSIGWKCLKQPRKPNNKRYTGKEFCKLLQSDGYITETKLLLDSTYNIIANIGSLHTIAIIDGKVNDTWDSTDGCVGNIYVKECNL